MTTALADADRRTALAWQVQSLLLDYPDGRLRERLPLLCRAAENLPCEVGGPLLTLCSHLDTTPPAALAADYVDTFDHRKRFSLFLTYFRHGDTRARGMALLRFQHAYRVAGYRIAPTELPDHLAVVLEFGATVDFEAGRRLLTEYRAGVELLRLGLREHGSPWFAVLESLSRTLPKLSRRERALVARIAENGPPEEEVGLGPYSAASPAGPAARAQGGATV
ncbi:nitrate reductase molybdenum cofactor assembly chaperone [Saccharomonospora xinjiangensis]|uniref:Nitrate reductase molybdenum cofactor assembly chaperone n=1 Tax=Saccharomonospora xinjiangensis XJ-54 TaxID=882086 RepID=I0V6K2_9PSEU|nr:nitrate reductase molybdenum cofactor assembly chaperone [Saccharomonospora xinjiangensis]EID55755.1 nitrate reductase molybdenum cofactor assembly chaperone [Saccharomonospora xinjiangensis XJ-54]